jgi:hypothetical protein
LVFPFLPIARHFSCSLFPMRTLKSPSKQDRIKEATATRQSLVSRCKRRQNKPPSQRRKSDQKTPNMIKQRDRKDMHLSIHLKESILRQPNPLTQNPNPLPHSLKLSNRLPMPLTPNIPMFPNPLIFLDSLCITHKAFACTSFPHCL